MTVVTTYNHISIVHSNMRKRIIGYMNQIQFYMYVLSYTMNNSLDVLSMRIVVDSFSNMNNNDAQEKYLSMYRRKCDKRKEKISYSVTYCFTITIITLFCLWFIHLSVLCTSTCVIIELNRFSMSNIFFSG